MNQCSGAGRVWNRGPLASIGRASENTLPGLHQRGGANPLVGVYEVLGAPLVVVAPAPPVVGPLGHMAAHNFAVVVHGVFGGRPVLGVAGIVVSTHISS